MSETRLQSALRAIPESVRALHVADARVIHLPASTPPWTALDVGLEAGDAFTLYAEGRVVLSEEAGLWNGASFHLWARVGGARSSSQRHARHGELRRRAQRNPRAVHLLGGVGESRRRHSPRRSKATRCSREASTCWSSAGAVGQRPASPLSSRPCRTSLCSRPSTSGLTTEEPSPAGWRHHWLLGPSAIYRSVERDGRPGIRAETSDDVGILQHPIDAPLTPGTRVGWEWRVEALPSAVAEDTLPTHDYLSVAFEFENGQDLTYLWSAAMPAGSHYRCPLPNWDQRETHMVVRSGAEGLGQWWREERALEPDYRTAIGEPPARVVAVWLISVSLFQKGRGAVEYRDLWIESGGQRLQVI